VPGAGASPAQPGAGGAAPGAAAPAATGLAAPPRIDVEDAMLADPTPPTEILATWTDAVAIMSTRDVEYAIALREIERAEGLRRQALAAALPTVTGTGSVRYEIFNRSQDAVAPGLAAFIPDPWTASAQITARHPLLAPRAWWGVGTADAVVDLARVSVEDRRRTLLAAAAESIVGVVTAQRVAEINRLGLRAALERLRLTERRLELGSGTRLDVVRFEQDVAAARATLVTGDEQLRRAQEALGLALGQNQAWGVPPELRIDALERDARALCQPTELADRADVRAAREQIELAERGVTDATLQYVPTIDVSSTFSISTQEQASGRDYAWNVQGLLTVPIFDGGSRYGARRVAVAEAEQARLRAEGVMRTASIEVAQADRAVQVAQTSLAVAKSARDLAAEVEQLSQRSFEAGAGTSFDLVDASRRLREAELQLAVREFELVQARIGALLARSSCSY
jgi:outer membrane protein TolC